VWWWVLIWTLLVVIAGVYLVARLWGLWGQVKELAAETERASSTLAALEAQVERLGEPAPPVPLAVFQDPRDLRHHRATTRAELRAQRTARRAERLPLWARDVD
jgi:hypothetical protein